MALAFLLQAQTSSSAFDSAPVGTQFHEACGQFRQSDPVCVFVRPRALEPTMGPLCPLLTPTSGRPQAPPIALISCHAIACAEGRGSFLLNGRSLAEAHAYAYAEVCGHCIVRQLENVCVPATYTPPTGPWVESACMSSCLHHLPPCSFVIFLCACHLYKRASGRRLVLYCPSSP